MEQSTQEPTVTTTDENANNSIGEHLKKVLAGEKPLVSTENEITINTANAAKTAAAVGAIMFLFALLTAFAKSKIQ